MKQVKDAPLLLQASGRTTVFSVTNRAGSVYEGFFELTAPAPPEKR
jgi:hypothetical protein